MHRSRVDKSKRYVATDSINIIIMYLYVYLLDDIVDVVDFHFSLKII